MHPVPPPNSTMEVAAEKSMGRSSRSIKYFELGMMVPEVRMFRASLINVDLGSAGCRLSHEAVHTLGNEQITGDQWHFPQ